MMSDTCILIIYTSQEQEVIFLANVTHKANGEQNGMLVICVDQKDDDTLEKSVCVSHKKSKVCDPFVIVI